MFKKIKVTFLNTCFKILTYFVGVPSEPVATIEIPNDHPYSAYDYLAGIQMYYEVFGKEARKQWRVIAISHYKNVAGVDNESIILTLEKQAYVAKPGIPVPSFIAKTEEIPDVVYLSLERTRRRRPWEHLENPPAASTDADISRASSGASPAYYASIRRLYYRAYAARKSHCATVPLKEGHYIPLWSAAIVATTVEDAIRDSDSENMAASCFTFAGLAKLLFAEIAQDGHAAELKNASPALTGQSPIFRFYDGKEVDIRPFLEKYEARCKVFFDEMIVNTRRIWQRIIGEERQQVDLVRKQAEEAKQLADEATPQLVDEARQRADEARRRAEEAEDHLRRTREGFAALDIREFQEHLSMSTPLALS